MAGWKLDVDVDHDVHYLRSLLSYVLHGFLITGKQLGWKSSLLATVCMQVVVPCHPYNGAEFGDRNHHTSKLIYFL